MRLRYPQTFIHLIVLGFVLVALPLALALFTSAVSMQKLAEQSKRAVYQSVHYARGSRAIAEDMTRMERLLRQYAVLGDAELLAAYQAAHQAMGRTLNDLQRSGAQGPLAQLLSGFAAREHVVYSRVIAAQGAPDRIEPLADELAGLNRLVDRLLAHGDTLVEREVAATQQMAAHSRDVVSRQLWLLLPAGVAVLLGFVWLISRPIRQIEQAIGTMGEGNLADPVAIDGPQDLQRLGQRLEWLRQQLQQVEEQKTRFLQQVSHDLKTPLAALREGADLLADGSMGAMPAAQAEVVGILQQNSVRLQRQIENLLQFSELQAQAGRISLTTTPLRPLVKKVLAASQLPLQTKCIEVDLLCQNVMIETDAEKLRVILDNLLSNAIRYTPYQGTIHVGLLLQHDQLQIDVADSGPGVAPDERGHIFERFYRGRADADARVRGSGLGLAIVAEFTRALQGSVEVLDSPSGAHFRVTLPAPV